MDRRIILRLCQWFRVFSPSEHWRRYCLLLLCLFVLRGGCLIALTPPLEAWDEYQHLAYIEHLHQHGKVPTLRSASVSRLLLREAVKFPQSRSMYEQTHGTGARQYEAFWNLGPPEYLSNHGEIGLYQAQHGSVYYQLALPVYRLAGGVDNLRLSIAVLRALNLLFGAFSLAIVMWCFGTLIEDRLVAGLIVGVVSLHPLCLQNFVRVANDPISILLGTVVIAWCLCPQHRFVAFTTILAGLSLGLAAAAKGTCLALFPFAVVSLAISATLGGLNWRSAATRALMVSIIGLAVISPQLLDSMEKYGTLTPMQEAVHNREIGIHTLDILKTSLNMRSLDVLRRIWFGDSLVGNGWSFLPTSKLWPRSFRILLFIGLTGWLAGLLQRRRTSPGSNSQLFPKPLPWQILNLVGWVSLALFWHILQSTTAWGVSTTNSWYTCLAIPFSLGFVLLGGMQWGRFTGFLAGALMAILFQITAIATLVTQVQSYSSTTGWEAFARLAQLQPSFLGTSTVMLFSLGSIFLHILIVGGWLHALFNCPSAVTDVQKFRSEITSLQT